MRWVRRVGPPVLTFLLAGFLIAGIGVQAEFAWAWAMLIAAIVLVIGIRMPDDPRIDAPGRPAEQPYVGSEVSRLSWAIEPRTGVGGEAVTRRVRAILVRRLARAGVDISDDEQRERVEQLLGEGLWERLSGHRVTVADIREALAAAQRLVPTDSAAQTASAAPSRENRS